MNSTAMSMLDTDSKPSRPPLPSADSLTTARSCLVSRLPDRGLGLDHVKQHLNNVIAPALSLSSQSSTYYGFVTGGATEAATFADHMCVEYDQNVQVHLPNETVATDVEDCALKMLLQLMDLYPWEWPHRTFTTGATASNVLGLAIGRQAIFDARSTRQGLKRLNVAEDGISAVMQQAGITSVQILTTAPHSSLRKAASIVGIGRSAVVDVGDSRESHRFDWDRLESILGRANTASIVVISAAEVNTGLFATRLRDVIRLRELCDRFGAWLHVDAAFGLLARALPRGGEAGIEFAELLTGCDDLEYVDSITGDAHKLLNVPYDCGFFFSKKLDLATEVFQNPNAAYLSSSNTAAIPSPLNIGMENSRRFRALPVYATLLAYGRDGYCDMIQRQVRLARSIAAFIVDSPEYELLPDRLYGRDSRLLLDEIYIVVLFRAKNQELNKTLVQRINDTRKIYVSGTTWDGRPAARFAVANWQADAQRDLAIVKEVLNAIIAD